MGYPRKKPFRFFVSDLLEKSGSIDRIDIYPRGSSCLHPPCHKSKRYELFGQSVRGEFTDPAAFKGSESDEKLSVQEGPGGQDNGLRFKNRPGIRTDSADY
jgi:hypothetical protein